MAVRLALAGALLLPVVLVAGCGGPARRQVAGPGAGAEAPVWPAPPEPARIRFVQAVAGPADLGIRPSFWSRVKGALTGAAPAEFVRPTGVAALDGRVFVADPGARTVWILDRSAGRSRRVRKVESAWLVSPVAVAADREGRVFVADSALARVFVLDAEGVPLGSIERPEMRRPAGLAYDIRVGRLYVADSAAHRVWVFAGDGSAAGSIGGRGTGDGEFNFPTHVALDGNGELFVTDALGFRIQSFSRTGEHLGSFGRHGDGSGDFAAPKGIALDAAGHVYVVDALFDAVQIFDRSGRYLLAFGGRGVGPGRFWLPGGMCIDERQRIYVADSYNRRVQIFESLSGVDDG